MFAGALVPPEPAVDAWSAAREALLAGEAPLWNPRVFLGAPLAADPSLALLSPLHLLALLALPAERALGLAFALNALLAALGTFWALRTWGLKAPPAAAGAALYALAPPVLHPGATLAAVGAAAWFPLVAGAALRLHRAGDFHGATRWALVAGAAAAGLVTAGGPSGAAALGVASVAFALASILHGGPAAARARRALAWIVAGAFGFALAAPQLLHARETAGELLWPPVPSTAPWSWRTQLDFLTDYVYRDGGWLPGILPLGRVYGPAALLAGAAGAVTALRRGAGALVAAGAAAFALDLLAPAPWRSAAQPWLVQAALAAAAAAALDRVWRWGARRQGVAAVAIVGTLTVFSLVATALTFRARASNPLPPAPEAMEGVWAAYALGALVLATTWTRRRLPRAAAGVVLTAGLAALAAHFWPLVPAAAAPRTRSTAASLGMASGDARILWIGAGHAPGGVDRADGAGGPALRAVAAFVEADLPGTVAGAWLARPAALRAAAVGRVVVEPGSLTDSLALYLREVGFEREGWGEGVIAYGIPGARPRAYWIASPDARGERVPARYGRRSPGTVRVAVEAPAPGWVVVADAAAPGWRATLDGRAVPWERVEDVFLGVPVPAGAHEVALRYAPRGFRAGAALGLIGAVAAGALVVRKRNRASPGGRPAL